MGNGRVNAMSSRETKRTGWQVDGWRGVAKLNAILGVSAMRNLRYELDASQIF